MKLDDSKAGKIGRCLQCNQKFRVPNDEVEEPEPETVKRGKTPPARDVSPKIPVIPKRSKEVEPPPPTCDADLMNRSGYELEQIGSARPPVKVPPSVELIAEEDDWEDEEEPNRLSALKKRRPLTGPQKQDVVTGLALAGILWIALTALSVWVPSAVYALLFVGALIVIVGRSMLLHLARQEGTGVWLACLLVPFYSTYFFFTRLHETYKSFLISCAGYVFVVTGVVLYFILIVFHAEPPDELVEPVPSVSWLRLRIEGEDLRLAIEGFNYFSVKRGRDEFPDRFQLEGKGMSIFGKFWIGFEEQWDELLNKPLEITSEDPGKTEGDSHLTLPGKGDLKILKGKLVVKSVINGRDNGDPYLKGDLELELKGKEPRQTLNIKGTFEAQVHSWH
jgi:hypothetical protein